MVAFFFFIEFGLVACLVTAAVVFLVAVWKAMRAHEALCAAVRDAMRDAQERRAT